MQWVGLQCVIVVFPDHIYSLAFLKNLILKKKSADDRMQKHEKLPNMQKDSKVLFNCTVKPV